MTDRNARARAPRAAALVALAALAAAALALALASGGPAASEPQGDFFDEAAVEGRAPDRTPEEARAELDRDVREGELAISIASVVEFAGPGAPGRAYIENAPDNLYDMTVEITLADSGETVYASKGIAPGSYVEDIVLAADLEPGEHEALATFTARDRETHAAKGTAAAKVTLVVR